MRTTILALLFVTGLPAAADAHLARPGPLADRPASMESSSGTVHRYLSPEDTVPARSARGLYVGFEYAELEQNRFRNLGVSNYTFFAGQRFPHPERRRFGWRVFSMNVELSPEHLADTRSVCCIDGNREGLEGTLNIQRLYLHYYPMDLRWRFLQVSPLLGTGAGYTAESTTNTRFEGENATSSFSSLTWVLNARLQTTLFDLLIVEHPVIELGVHRRREQVWIGDAYLTAPHYISGNGWLNIGIRLPL